MKGEQISLDEFIENMHCRLDDLLQRYLVAADSQTLPSATRLFEAFVAGITLAIQCIEDTSILPESKG